MVRVPTQPLSSVETAPAQPVYASPEVPRGVFDKGSGLINAGEKMGDVADSLQKIAIKMKQQDDEAEAREHDVAVSRAINSVVFGDPTTGSQGYLTSKGKDAQVNYGAAEEAISAAVQNALQSASNGTVARMVGASTKARQERAVTQMTSHAAQQREVYMNGMNEAREAQAASDAGLNYTDNKAIDASLGVIQEENKNWASRNGVSEEEAAMRLASKESEVVKAAIAAASAGSDFGRAQQLFTLYGGMLDGKTKTLVEQKLRADMFMARQLSAMAKSEAQQKTQNDLLSALVNGKLTTDQIMNSNLDAFGSGSKHQFISMLERGDAQDTKHPVLYNELVKRIYLPEDDQNRLADEKDIYAHISAGDLSAKEGHQLASQIQELRKPDDAEAKKYGKTAAKAWGDYAKLGREVLVKTNAMGMTDPNGANEFYNWQFRQKALWEKRIAEGKDPLDLLNPDSKDYLGTPKAKSPQQIMREQAERMRSAPGVVDPATGGVPDEVKRKPGESIDDWKKRVGK